MNIMALDISTKSTGCAIFKDNKLDSYNCYTATSKELIRRIRKIIQNIDDAIAENGIDIIVIEEVRPDDEKATNNNAHRALMWIQAALAFMLFDKYPDIKIEYIYPSQWRKNCGIKTGRGIKRDSLKKADIDFVKQRYNLSVNDDIADAICIAHGYLDLENEGFNWE